VQAQSRFRTQLCRGIIDPKYDYSFWKKLSMPDVYQLTFQHLVLRDVKRIWQE